MAAAKPLLAVLLLSLLAAASASASAISDGDISLPFTLLPAAPAAGGCRGSVGECLAGDDDDELGLGHHGRALYGSGRYLSYRALQRDSVPCSRRGDSYYNCRPGAAANPYSRGCSRITRCRG